MEDVDKALPQDQHAHLARMMLKQLNRGEITLEEYLMQCAYWGVKTLGDIYFKSLPDKPLEIIEYEQISYYKRQKLSQGFFVDHPGIMRYYEERDKIVLENSNNLWRLKTYKKYIPESDIKSHEKLDKAIMDFRKRTAGYED
jgi:hypothetical protein